MISPPLTGPIATPPDGTDVSSAVIFLHGYGADGNDLIELAPFFAQALPQTVFLAPDAPSPCEMSAFGRQWFSLASYDPEELRRDPHRMGSIHAMMLDGAQKAAPVLNRFIDWVGQQWGLASGEIALVGFSQGTMMALHVALRRPDSLACVVGFSGALVGAESLNDEITAKPPVRLIHGEADPVVPFEAMGAAEKALQGAAVPVDSFARPHLEHGIDPAGAAHAREFVAKYLA